MYRGCCIIAVSEGKSMPFSFCALCWVENGSPKAVEA